MGFLKKWLRRLGALYLWAWVLVIVIAILVGALDDRADGINVIATGWDYLVTTPMLFVGSGLIAGLANQTHTADEAAFNMGRIVGLIAIIAVIYMAVKDRKKAKQKPKAKKRRYYEEEEEAH